MNRKSLFYIRLIESVSREQFSQIWYHADVKKKDNEQHLDTVPDEDPDVNDVLEDIIDAVCQDV